MAEVPVSPGSGVAPATGQAAPGGLVSATAASTTWPDRDVRDLAGGTLALDIALAGFAFLGLRIRRRRRNAGIGRPAPSAPSLLRDLFEASPDQQFIFEATAPDRFRLMAWNPSAARAAGKGEEVLGQTIEAVLEPDPAERMRTALTRAIATGETVRVQEQMEAALLEITCEPWREPGTQALDRVFVRIRDVTHLRSAELAAREANRLLVMAEQVAHVGHWHLQLRTRELKWSDEVYRIHGLEPGSVTPTIRSSLAAYHPEDRARVWASVAGAVRRREGFDIALRLVRPSGEIRDVLVRGLCQFEPATESGTGRVRSIFGVFADVTELKQAERALADKSNQLTATLESMDQGLLMIAADGTVPVINRRAAEILALPPELMSARADYRALRRHLRASGAWGTSIQDPKHWHLDENRRTFDLRSERRRADGSVIEIRSLPLLTGDGHVQTLTDVTHRRRSDERLRESEARYRLLADHTSDLIVLDDASGRHLYISPAVTSLLGYSAEAANRIGLRTLVHGEDIAQLTATLGALSRDRPSGSAVYRMRHESGHELWVEAAFRLVEDNGGIQIIQALRDVTQRQTQEANLRSARIAAEAAVRAKSEFLATMSHELRTPLAGILGVQDLLYEDQSLSRDQGRLIGLARESARSLLTIVNDILDFSKIEAGHLVIEALPFSLRSVIEGCRELSVETLAGRELRFGVEIAPEVPNWVLGDPMRLRQVILNLATNAIKFTPRGAITLRALWRTSPAGARGPRTRLRIEVVDTGIGILPETLPLLFERFAQADGSTSRHYGGTGLGLTICKRLVHLMGGEIGVESRFGEGSTFWFEVPLRLAAPEGELPERARPLLQKSTGSLMRVLLAEDNTINQEIIGTVLRQKGHTVTVVDDGERATAAVLEGGPFDLVLMDVQMPGQDGLAATRAIRAGERAQGRAPVPIVALTANAMSEEIERCYGAGMDAHVAKPVDWTALFATMERLGGDPGARGEAPGRRPALG